MAINSISSLKTQQVNTPSVATRVQERPAVTETQQVRENRDTLELSGQTQPVRENRRNESLQQIQTQVSTGFYNQPEVIQETAVRVARELEPA